MVLTLEMWSKAKEQIEKNLRRTWLNATCPHCQADVLDELESAAYDWGIHPTPPATCTIECPSCETDITHRLQWRTILDSPEIIGK